MNTNTIPQVPAQIAIDTVTGATDKQIAFMHKLMEKIDFKITGVTSDEALGAQTICSSIRHYLTNMAMNKRQASALIETLIKTSEINYGVSTAVVVNQVVQPREAAPLGIYREGETIYCVRKARQSERVYAYQLIIIEGQNPRWDYVAGKVYELKVENMISLEAAAHYGRRTGICCICGRYLSDASSVQKGIGPVCESKYSGIYFRRNN